MTETSSRQKILDFISRGPTTVPEIGASLDMTRNAVVVQVQRLVADGLIQRDGTQRTGGAGKPGVIYSVVSGTEDLQSAAYGPLLEQLLIVIGERLRPDEMVSILEAAGTRLARNAQKHAEAPVQERISDAIAVVNSLGACAEIVQAEAGRYVVENWRCPFARAVRQDACVCHAAAAFFREATGLPFEQKCDRQDRLTCRYVADVA